MASEPLGFIRSMQDVKTLALFVLSRLNKPVPMTTLYELCFQDDRLSYFDLALAVPQLAENGLITIEDEQYAITDVGRSDSQVLESDLPLSLRTRCAEAIEKYQDDLRRSEHAHCEIKERDDGLFDVVMTQDSAFGQLLKLEMMAPNLNQARAIERAWRRNADGVFRMVMSTLTAKDS